MAAAVEGTSRSVRDKTKWETELRLRERELAIKDREQDTKEREVDARVAELERSRWTSPLVLAIFAAAIGALSNAGIALYNGSQQHELENLKADSARILQMLDTRDGNQNVGRKIQFLIEAGLISNEDTRDRLEQILSSARSDQFRLDKDCTLPENARPDLALQWLNVGCNYRFPPGDGFLSFPTTLNLEPGTLVERFGSPAGRFLHPSGTPFEQLSLPYPPTHLPYSRYKVLKQLSVKSGPIRPWFGQPGRGTQYLFEKSIFQLLEGGYLEKVSE